MFNFFVSCFSKLTLEKANIGNWFNSNLQRKISVLHPGKTRNAVRKLQLRRSFFVFAVWLISYGDIVVRGMERSMKNCRFLLLGKVFVNRCSPIFGIDLLSERALYSSRNSYVLLMFLDLLGTVIFTCNMQSARFLNFCAESFGTKKC